MEYTPFHTPSAIFGPPGGHFGFYSRWGVLGGAALQAVSECTSAARLVFK